MNNLYGIPMIIIGAGCARRYRGRPHADSVRLSRWITLCWASTSSLCCSLRLRTVRLGRPAIGIWTLLFGTLGYTLWRRRIVSR